MIPFGPWLPDRPNLQNPGATVALNVVPMPGGYGPFQGGNVVSNALTSACKGAASFKQVDGSSFNFAGDSTTLYTLNGTSWDDIGAKVYNVAFFNQWKFAQFGTLILAVNGSDKIQKIRAGTDSVFTEITGTDTPSPEFITVVKEFVVVGPITISNEINIQWSARNDATSWTIGTNSASTQPLFEGGPLQGMTGGDFGIILQEFSITRMNFVGGDLIFTFDVIEGAKGCLVPGSIIQWGAITYYWSEDGVEAFNNTGSQNIGNGKVNKTLLDRLDTSKFHLVTATVDPIRRLILWSYPTLSDGNRLLIYNIGENNFSDVVLDVQVLVSSKTVAVSIDDIAGSIDDSPLTGFPGVTSLDDPALFGGIRQLSAFNTDNKLATLDGDALAATLETGEIVLGAGGSLVSENKKVHTRRLRGVIDGTHTLNVKHRSKLQESVTTSTGSLQDDGSTPTQVNDRYQSLELKTLAAADWTFTQGVDLEEVTKGGR